MVDEWLIFLNFRTLSFFRFGYEDIRGAINNYKKKIYNEIYNEKTVGNEV